VEATAEETIIGTDLIPSEIKERIVGALKYWEGVKDIKVTTQEEYDSTVTVCKNLKGGVKLLEDKRKELVKPLNDQVNEINAAFKEPRETLENGEHKLKLAMAAYYAEQERLRIEKQRKLQAEAEEKARKEKEKAAAELAKAEAYREQGREEMAEKAEARAETHVDRADNTVVETVQNTAKTSGVSFSTFYKANVIDLKAYLAHVLSSDASFGQLAPTIVVDLKILEKIQKAMSGAYMVPGVSFTEDRRVSVRGA
jgi:hypothetical protein